MFLGTSSVKKIKIERNRVFLVNKDVLQNFDRKFFFHSLSVLKKATTEVCFFFPPHLKYPTYTTTCRY